jgi:hypothetical protein
MKGAGINSESDFLLGILAIKRARLKMQDLDRCLRVQRELAAAGAHLRLGQIMVREDLISTTQLVGLLDEQRNLRTGP